MSIITLTTDFGLTDVYVGAMKGAVLSVNPRAILVDLSHRIRPHDIRQGAYQLSASFGFFPPGTVHLAVVDPGVGSTRAILAGQFCGQFFVAPDNGLLTMVHHKCVPEKLVKVEKEAFSRSSISPTFHGRDIMAPVAAHLSLGVELDQLGPPVDTQAITMLDIERCQLSGSKGLSGTVIDIDRFGNIITNIDQDALSLLNAPSKANLEIKVGPQRILGLLDYYTQVAPQTLLALVGSSGFLEIALTQGHAARFLGAQMGMAIGVGVRKGSDENG